MKKGENYKIEKRFLNVEKSTTFKHILDQLDLREKTVLDIGCSFGEFLVHFGEGSVGLTISHKEEAYGLTRGLDIRYGNIESGDVPVHEKFDVIFANNIFEHLYSPHGFLIDIKNYLKKDGVLVLGVPCIPILSFLVHIKKFQGSLAVSHINFFKKMTLMKTVERAGWTIGCIRSFHLSNRYLDRFMDFIAPHFYVTATANQNFEYDEKRKAELKGYKSI